MTGRKTSWVQKTERSQPDPPDSGRQTTRSARSPSKHFGSPICTETAKKNTKWVGVGYRICNFHWVIACKKNLESRNIMKHLRCIPLGQQFRARPPWRYSTKVSGCEPLDHQASTAGMHGVYHGWRNVCIPKTVQYGTKKNKWYDIINRISIVYLISYIPVTSQYIKYIHQTLQHSAIPCSPCFNSQLDTSSRQRSDSLQGPAVGRSFLDHNPWPQMSHKKLVGLYRDSFLIWMNL